MPKSLQVATASGLCAVAVVAGLWLSHDPGGRSAEPGAVDEIELQTGEAGSAEPPASPFAVSTDTSVPGGSSVVAVSPEQTPSQVEDRLNESTLPASLPLIDVSELARSAISDEDFDAIVERLRADPALLQSLIDEFRQEQDLDRRQLLMKLLGHAGGADVTLLASELVYSGNEESRQLGLQMLQRAQPGSAEVQQIASELLATEIEPRTLVSTLATLARPGTIDTENRTLVADQVAVMASHPDAGVRGVSLDILSRLSVDGRDTPVLLAGLADSSERVREAAAYALVDHEDDSVAVRSSLWQLLRNSDEARPTRSAAIMALRSLTLSDEEQNELKAIERQLNTVRRQP